MYCTLAYVKKNNCFTDPQFLYSDCCMHVSHKNDKLSKEKTARKETFCNVTLFPPQIMQKNSLFCKFRVGHFCLLTVFYYHKYFQNI